MNIRILIGMPMIILTPFVAANYGVLQGCIIFLFGIGMAFWGLYALERKAR